MGESGVAGKTVLDRITLAGIELRPRLGAEPGEQRIPQRCLADLTIWGDFEAAAATDNLAAAVDYSKILAKAKEVSLAQGYNLLETLAYRLGRAVIEGFPVHRVSVRVRKRPASMAETLEYVEVEVEQA
jgi:dihydroneopterin aldolase